MSIATHRIFLKPRPAPLHFLGDAPHPSNLPSTPNGAIHVVSNIMEQVVSSAAEAELGALFYNGKEAEVLRTTLQEMGYPQPPTLMLTDNKMAAGIAMDTVKQRRSKAIDMRFYWVRDHVHQGHFRILWQKGADKRADYFTKHHPTSHHRLQRYQYLHHAPRRPQ